MAPNFSEEDSMFGLYFILGILLGSIPAIYFLYKMLRDINDSNFELMLDESYQSNKTKKNQSIETATCRICDTFHTNRNPLSLGGCVALLCSCKIKMCTDEAKKQNDTAVRGHQHYKL